MKGFDTYPRMQARLWLAGLALSFVLGVWHQPGLAAGSPEYPQSLEEEIKSLLAAGANESSDPVFLTKLAGLYLDAGDDLYRKKSKRRQAYEEGARIAKRALELQELNAQAHYFYAANLGSAAELKGILAGVLTIRRLKKHLSRALELDPDYSAALHMKGMLLEELPGLLGGDSEEALRYLQRAIEVDPTYTHARLNLAKAYIARDNVPAAERQLRAILATKQPRNPYMWSRRHKPEAEKLLRSLQGASP